MKFFISVFLFFYIFFIPSFSHANSTYVLPYPSAMPGSIFYNFNLIKEKLLNIWYFGDFGRYHFNLMMSDKYLVEAKTLFDYGQYLLGSNALKKSNEYFLRIYPNLATAEVNGKDISDKLLIYKNAARKHIEELENLKNVVPNTFEWNPEKGGSTTLHLLDSLSNSIILREKAL